MKGRIKRWLSEFVAEKNKRFFGKSINDILTSNNIEQNVNLSLVSFSGEKQLYDQIYSILSFYMNVGKPLSWIIFSDGTHTEKSIVTLQSIPGVTIKKIEETFIPLEYGADKNPLLKKIFYYKTIPVEGTTIFVDSDVLFYKTFKNFIPIICTNNWFLVDEGYGYLDAAYTEKIPFDTYPCNSGLLVFNSEPQWEVVLNYIEAQSKHKDGLQNWSEQTAFHILTRGFNGIYPLDPRFFVVSGSDSFKYSSDFDYNKIAIRHFVGPIRHKMWQYSWKKVLQVKL